MLNEKSKRILIMLGAFGGLLAIIVIGLWASDRSSDRIPASARVTDVSTFSTPGSRIDPAQVWITQSESDISTLKQQNTQLQQQLERLQKDLDGLNQRQNQDRADRADRNNKSNDADAAAGYPQAEVPDSSADATGFLPNFLPRPGAGANQAISSITEALVSDLNSTETKPATPAQPESFEIMSLSLATPKAAVDSSDVKEVKRRTVQNFLPAGSFITATLLSGANAPTGGLAQSDPVPTLFQLDDQGNLPNGFSSRVRDCRITTATYGDLASERAYSRTEKMTCISHSGEVLETNIRGYISGEDGMAGMRGPVVEKRGRMIALSMLSGLFGGIGSSLSQGLTTLSTNSLGNVMSVDPKDSLEYGAWSGAGRAMERLADWYLERANELYPVIEIHAGRYAQVVLTDGLDLDIDLWAEAEGDWK